MWWHSGKSDYDEPRSILTKKMGALGRPSDFKRNSVQGERRNEVKGEMIKNRVWKFLSNCILASERNIFYF
jgi:hypothetical protein